MCVSFPVWHLFKDVAGFPDLWNELVMYNVIIIKRNNGKNYRNKIQLCFFVSSG